MVERHDEFSIAQFPNDITKVMNIDQLYIRALAGQIIHRNGLWLKERVAEDMPSAYFMYAKLEKHNVDQLRRWLS